MRRATINLLLRVLVKPIWRRAPSIDLLRRRAAVVDRRFGGAAADDPCLALRLSNELGACPDKPPVTAVPAALWAADEATRSRCSSSRSARRANRRPGDWPTSAVRPRRSRTS
jgi:hypothetical protein